MPNRDRSINLNFWVTPAEKETIQKKMEQLHIKNLSAYLRKVAIDGHILNLDTKPLEEIASALRRNGANINQIAKRANESNVFDQDIQEIKRRQAEQWAAFVEVLKIFGKA